MSDGYIGTTERAAIIRAELKAKHKWTSRDVSVKADHFSMGSAIRISIKNPAVPLAAVKEIAEAHESISRDASGEILSGGNRYLDIGYSSEAREALAALWLPAVEKAAETLASEGNDSLLVPVEGAPGFLLGMGRHGLRFGFSVWKEGGHDSEVSNAKEAALVIGLGGRRSS